MQWRTTNLEIRKRRSIWIIRDDTVHRRAGFCVRRSGQCRHPEPVPARHADLRHRPARRAILVAGERARLDIDDLQCIGADADGREHRLALSCKSNLQVTGKGLPSEYVSAAWSLWRAGDRFNRETDRMALVTRGGTPRSARPGTNIKGWCAGGGPGLAMARIDASARHRRVFDSVHAPGMAEAPSCDRRHSRADFQHLDVYPVDFQLTPSGRLATARHRCRMALVSESIEEADALWHALVQRAEDARLDNGTITLVELLLGLSATFALKAHPSISADGRACSPPPPIVARASRRHCPTAMS